ncbi:MAG: DUF72 domain-containing protein [Desulfurobacteriaceae bacterium]
MVIVGTSGYYYREWVGRFYPEGLPTSRWLEFYSQHLNGLEVNSTFYRPPSEKSVKKLLKYPLYYSLKLCREITHKRSLREELLTPFFRAKDVLGGKLITLLAQFPPSFKPKEAEFLFKLIEAFKEKGIAVTVELRNLDWERGLKELKERKIPVACISFPERLSWLKKCVKTEEVTYLRLHGKEELYRGSYKEELPKIADWIKKSPSKKKLIFFNNTMGKAFEDAVELLKLLS